MGEERSDRFGRYTCFVRRERRLHPLTVITSVYNGSVDLLRASLESILTQTFEHFEFILVDDGSSDETARLLMEFFERDPRVVLLRNRENLGLTRSLIRAMAHVRSMYVARHDADDSSLPWRLSFQMQFFPDYDVVCSRSLLNDNRIFPRFLTTVFHRQVAIFKNPYIHGTLCFKRALYEACGGYDERDRFAQDYGLMLRFLKHRARIQYIWRDLYRSFKRPQCLSKRYARQQQESFLRIRRNYWAGLFSFGKDGGRSAMPAFSRKAVAAQDVSGARPAEPLVSVVLPSYNGLSRGYLISALQSVLQQTYRHFELIIVDDGSTDGTVEACAPFRQDTRVKLVSQPNQGLAAARRAGVDMCRGELIAFLDDDDTWAPDKLAAQVDFFRNSPDSGLGMVVTDVRLIDEAGNFLGVRYARLAGDIYRDLVLRGNRLTAPSAVMLRREVIQEVGNFNAEMKSVEDFEMWMRVARCYPVYSIPKPLTYYRVHGNTISAKQFHREEVFEIFLYERILQQETFWDPALLFSRMYQRFAIRHFSIGNYLLAYRWARRSLRKKFSLYSLLLWGVSILPRHFLDALKWLRRRVNWGSYCLYLCCGERSSCKKTVSADHQMTVAP